MERMIVPTQQRIDNLRDPVIFYNVELWNGQGRVKP